jgi:epsilon-lactone hydrolase
MSLHAQLFKFFLWICQRFLIQADDPARVARLGTKVTDLMQRINKMAKQSSYSHFKVRHVGVEVIHNHRPDAQAQEILLFLHGGGFSFGSPANYRHFLSRLCQRAQIAKAWVPDYCLVPQKPFPAGVEDVVLVWKEMIQRHDPAHIVLGGDSAGGNLSLALCMACKQQGLPMPKRVYLSSPWLDITLAIDDTRPEVSDAFLGRDELKARQWIKAMFADPYATTHDRTDPLMSPVLGDLQGMPPIYVQVAEDELFMPDSLLLMRRARELSLQCEVDVWKGMFHDFPIFVPRMKEANAAVIAAATWLRDGAVQRPAYYRDNIRQLRSPLN